MHSDIFEGILKSSENWGMDDEEEREGWHLMSCSWSNSYRDNSLQPQTSYIRTRYCDAVMEPCVSEQFPSRACVVIHHPRSQLRIR